MRKSLLILALAFVAIFAVAPPLGAQVYLINEDFNGISSGIPQGWDNSDGTITTLAYRWSFYEQGHTGSCLRLNSYSAPEDSYNLLKTPAVDLSPGGTLSFWFKNAAGGRIEVCYTTDGTTLVPIDTIRQVAAWRQYTYTLPHLGSATRIVFKGVSNYGSGDAYLLLDDVQVWINPTCAWPTGLALSSLTSTSAQLVWNLTPGAIPGSYTISVTSQAGLAVFNDTIPSGQSFSVSGLTPATTYNVLLNGSCSDTYNGSSGPVSFTFATPCLAQDLPYYEGFDDATLPACVYSQNADVTSSVKRGTSGFAAALSVTDVNSAYIVFPELNLPSDSVEVDFWIKAATVGTAKARYMVGLVTDIADIAGSFEPLRFDSLVNTDWTPVRLNTLLSQNGTQPTARMAISVQNTSPNTCYIDNVDIHHVPACIRPEDVTLTDYTATTASLSWTMTNATTLRAMIVAGADTTYQTITGANGVATLTDLTPNTEYRIYLSGDCGNGEYSAWSRTYVELRTLCLPATTPLFNESFESLITFTGAPECWSQGWISKPYTNTLARPFGESTAAHAGNKGYQLLRQERGSVAYLASPAITVDAAGAYDVALWVRRDNAPTYAGEQLSVWVNTVPNSTTGGTCLGIISRDFSSAPAEAAAGWYNYNFPINATGTLYVIIVGVSQNGAALCFDEVAVINHINCSRVTNIVADVPTETGCNITWSGSSAQSEWQVSYRLSNGTGLVTDTTVITTQPRLALNGLKPSSQYHIEGTVRGICSVGDTAMGSDFIKDFATECGIISTFPILEGFEQSETGSYPHCWTVGATTGTLPRVAEGRSTSSTRYDGQRSLSFSDKPSGNSSWLVTPEIDFGTAGLNYEISFELLRTSVYNESQYANEGVYVYIGDTIDYRADSLIGFAPRMIDAVPKVSLQGFYEFSFSLPATLATGHKYVVFRYGNEYGDGTYMDNISITAGNACANVVASVKSTDATEVVIAAADTTVGEWQVAYGSPGMPADSCTVQTVTGPDATISGLTPLTTYNYYFRRICGAGDTSVWSRSQSFTTAATSIGMPFVCGFENDSINRLWEVASYGPTHFAVGSEAAGVCSGDSAFYVQYNGRYTYQHDNYDDEHTSHAYVLLHFEESGYQVEFSWKATGGDNCCDFGRIMLLPASFNPSTINVRQNPLGSISFGESGNNSSSRYLSGTQGDARGWNHVSELVDMRGRSGDYYMLLIWYNDDSAGDNYPLSVDNINIYELTCMNPIINVSDLTDQAVTLSYNQPKATQYEIIVDDSPINVELIDDNTTYLHRATDTTGFTLIAGLTPNTEYYYTIRTICHGNDTAAWAIPSTFTTYCVPYGVPYTEDFENATAANCWSPLGSDRSKVARSTAQHHSGSASFKIDKTTAIAPELIVDSLNRYMVNGWAYATTDSATLGVGLIVDPNDGSTYENFADVIIPRKNTWTEFAAYFTDLDDPEYTEMRQARNVVLASGTDVVYVDDIYVDITPTCPKPNEVLISNISSDGFDIAFTDNAGASAWVVDCSGYRQTITTNPATVTGLSSHTDYVVQIAAICSASDTSRFTYVGPITTMCTAMPLPYYQSFEDLPTTYRPGMISDYCWTSIGSVATTTGYPRYQGVVNSSSTAGGKLLILYGSAARPQYMILPEFLAGQHLVMTLDVKFSSTGADNLAIGYITDEADATTFVPIDTASSSTRWATYTVDYQSMPAGARMALLHNSTMNAHQCFIDNLEVNEYRSCPSPLPPVVADIATTSATFNFADEEVSHNAWEWLCIPEGVDPNDASLTPEAVDSTMSATAVGLTPDTEYRVYVRAICSPGDESAWKVANFHTACAPFAVTLNTPYHDSFENAPANVAIGGCYDTEGFTASYNMKGYSNTASYTYARSGDMCLYSYVYNVPAGIAMKRDFYLRAGHIYEASVWARTTTYVSNVDMVLIGANDTIKLVDAELASCAYRYADNVYNYQDCYQELVNGFTVPEDGVYTLRLHCIRKSLPTSSFYIYLDDLSLEELNCPNIRVAPTPSSPSATTAVVTVDMMNKPEAEVGWAPTTATVAARNIVGTALTTTGTAIATGLTPGTGYTYFYRLICAPGDTSRWSPASESLVTFATDCFAPQDIATRALGSSTATVGWRPAPFTASVDYELSYGTTLVAQGSTTADTVAFSGLESAHTYTVRLRAHCQGGDTTDWSTYSFITDAGIVTAPFVCDFEDTDFNHQWTMHTAEGINRFVTGTAINNGGSRSLYVTNDGTAYQYSNGTSLTYAEMRVTFAPGDWFVSYDWRSNGEATADGGRLFLIPDTATDFTVTCSSLPAGAVSLEDRGVMNQRNYWNTTRTVFSNNDSQPRTYRLVAAWVNNETNGSQSPLALDNFSVQPLACVYPGRVRVRDYTTEGATFVVTRGDSNKALEYTIGVGAEPADSAAWTSIAAGRETDTIVATGLNAGVEYTLFVRHVCDDDVTYSPVIATRFMTLAQGMGVLPFVCSFESTEDLSGWSMDNDLSPSFFIVGSAESLAGTNSLYVTDDSSSYHYSGNATYTYATLPIFFDQSGLVDYSFSWKCVGEGSCDYGRVYLAPADYNPQDGVPAGAPSTIVLPAGCIALDNSSPLYNHSDWQVVTGQITVSEAGVRKLVVFWHHDSSDEYQPPLAVDNISMVYRSCPALSRQNLSLEWTSDNSANLRVFNNSEGASLNYLICTDAGMTDTIVSGTSPATADTCLIALADLPMNTSFYLRLISVCGPDEQSDPYTFTFRTKCLPVTSLPWSEGFETLDPVLNTGTLDNNCWMVYNSLIKDSKHWSCVWPNAGESSYDFVAHTGINGLFTGNGSDGTANTTHITAMPAMTGLSGKMLSFWSRNAGQFATVDRAEYGFLTNPDEATSFVRLGDVQLLGSWTETRVQLPTLPDTSRLAFRSVGTGYACYDDIRVYGTYNGAEYYDSVCNNQSYIAHGFNVPYTQLVPGDNTLTRTIEGAMDTIITAHVYRRPEIFVTLYDTICGGQSYNRGNWDIDNPSSRMYQDEFPSAAGCDSVVYLYLTVLPSSNHFNDTICSGQSYTFGDQTLTATGLYVRNYTSPAGCTMTDSLSLVVLPDTVASTVSVCSDQVPYTWRGRTLTASGRYTDVAVGARGCTQTYLIDFTVIPSDSMINVAFCQGGQIYVVDTIISTAGNYTLTRVNPIGCDIVYHITATVTEPQPEVIRDVACQDKAYNGYGIQGLDVTADTVVIITTRTADALCDSVVELHITYHPTVTSEFTVRINQGETYEWNDNTYSVAGDYPGTFQDRYGCDSVVTLHLEVGNGVDDAYANGHIRVVPNPAGAGQAALVFVSGTGEIARVEVINSYGAVVDVWEPRSTPIDLTAPRTAGVYHVRVITADGRVYVEKLIVK